MLALQLQQVYQTLTFIPHDIIHYLIVPYLVSNCIECHQTYMADTEGKTTMCTNCAFIENFARVIHISTKSAKRCLQSVMDYSSKKLTGPDLRYPRDDFDLLYAYYTRAAYYVRAAKGLQAHNPNWKIMFSYTKKIMFPNIQGLPPPTDDINTIMLDSDNDPMRQWRTDNYFF